MSDIDDIVGEFLLESSENLDRYDEDVLCLERDPDDAAALDSIFRTVHTIKGTCGFFGFQRLESVAHAAETLLDQVRRGESPVTTKLTDALLATGDVLRAMLTHLEATGVEDESDHAELLATLRELQDAAPDDTEDEAADAGDASDGRPRVDSRLGSLLIEQGAVDPADVGLALHSQELGDRRAIGEILIERGATDRETVDAALARQANVRASAGDRSIRVDVGLLDELMNLVSELVLARNRIARLVAQNHESPFAPASQRLDTITTDLQERAMKTRMQPISTVSNKLPRLVRDVGAACGKQVRLEVHGQGTELDRNVLEAVRDPLTHLVRNAIDHGLETPERRAVAGKPEQGVLTVRAFHEGGQVHIEVSDDGGGLDVQRLLVRAVERGVVTRERAAAMSSREALEVIFAPGFSTAAEVTEVSGRGVGLDVVRTNVERVGGTVEVTTEPGAGTTFGLTIPLTLAIVPALVVVSCGERYAIPQLSLVELLRLEGADARAGIEWVEGTPVHRLRGRLVPIVRLDAELGAAGGADELPAAINIAVLQADGQEFGLVVDEVTDTEEIVVKPLGAHLEDVGLFAGATIMGDGCVALILDVPGLAHRARVVVAGGREQPDASEATEVADAPTERRTVVLATVGERHRVALPLSEVARLDVIDANTVELADGREVVQHRGEIMPLVELGELQGCGPAPRDGGSLNVIVHEAAGRQVGLVVGRILDVVEHEVVAGEAWPGSSIIIDGRVTDVVDAGPIVASLLPPVPDAVASHGGAA